MAPDQRVLAPQIRPVLLDRATFRAAVDLLVVTATEVERDAVLHRLRPLGKRKTIVRGASGPSTYYFGSLGPHGVVVTMCRAGTGTNGGAKDTVAESCTLWTPRAVVMVGIAFGKDPEKQGIGDVLVSSDILSYEEQRVGARDKFRGPAGEASRTLVDRFRNAGWTFLRPDGSACKYKVGPILSGEKLVDDAAFKARLFERFSHAIGGEMEGRGLYAAAHAAKVDWILVKGICDWGDGSKHDEDQPFAAAAAVDLMCAALSGEGALDGLSKPPEGETGARPPGRPARPGPKAAMGAALPFAGPASTPLQLSIPLEALTSFLCSLFSQADLLAFLKRDSRCREVLASSAVGAGQACQSRGIPAAVDSPAPRPAHKKAYVDCQSCANHKPVSAPYPQHGGDPRAQRASPRPRLEERAGLTVS